MRRNINMFHMSESTWYALAHNRQGLLLTGANAAAT